MSLDRQLAIIGIVVGLFGVLAAWYFYMASLPTRTPTFMVDTVRAVLIDDGSSGTSELTVQYKGRKISHNSVNIVRVYFWNAGNSPIQRSDILRQFTSGISGDSEILDAKILKASRELTGISVDVQEAKRNTANVKFELLETYDGASLQITYAGPRDAELEFNGATIGSSQPSIKKIEGMSFHEERRSSPLLKLLSMVLTDLAISVAIVCYTPFIRRLAFSDILKSGKVTDFEIKAYTTWFIILLFLLLVVLTTYMTPEITGEIPSALIIKD